VPYALYANTAKTSTDAVKLTGNQTVEGNKIFNGTTSVLTPVNATDATNKAYVDILKSQIENILVQIGISDNDGNLYNVVKIGTQLWMSDNLRTTKYQNGDLIGTTTPATLNISGETTPKYQWAYNGNEMNALSYGRLYSWYAVTDNRKICPIGWHIPNDAEWTTLTDYLTNNGYGFQGSGSDIAKSMAENGLWQTDGTAGNVGNDQASNNKSGFRAVPGGFRYQEGPFEDLGNSVSWWSSTEAMATWAYTRDLSYDSGNVLKWASREKDGFSVRCLRD
jgi:uncharacterized protein (TIGR02145 family)